MNLRRYAGANESANLARLSAHARPFDLQQIHRITDSFIKINRINKYFLGHTQQLNHRKSEFMCHLLGFSHKSFWPGAHSETPSRSEINL